MGRTIFRHISWQYLINVLVLHVVLFGFVVVIDVFVNLRRFVGSATDGLAAAGADDPSSVVVALTTIANIVDLWWPRLLQLSAYLSGLVLVAAMGFTCVQMVRHREFVALLASGVSLHRLASPFLAVAVLFAGFQIVNQEFIIPDLAEKLQRDPGDAGAEVRGEFAIELVEDGQGRVFSAGLFDAATDTMRDVVVFERNDAGAVLSIVTASTAAHTGDGWALQGGTRRLTPAGFRARGQQPTPSATEAGADASNDPDDVFDPFDPRSTANERSRPDTANADPAQAADALDPRRTAVEFIASPLDPEQLKVRKLAGLAQSLSWTQLGRVIDAPSLPDADRDRLNRLRWGRYAALLSGLLTLVATLPFFLQRTPMPMLKPSLRAFPIAGLGLAAGAAAPNVALPGLPVVIAVFVPSLILAPLAVALFTSIKT